MYNYISEQKRPAGIAIAFLSFCLICVIIHISTYDVDFGIRVWTERVIEPGDKTAIRVGVIGRKDGRPLPDSTAIISLSSEELSVGIDEVQSNDLGFIEDILEIPADFPPGPYLLNISVRIGREEEKSVFPINIVPKGTGSLKEWAVLRNICEESSGKRADGSLHPARRCLSEPGSFHLYPDGGHFVAHVRQKVFLWYREKMKKESPDFTRDENQDPADADSVEVLPDSEIPKDSMPFMPGTVKIIPLAAALAGQKEEELEEGRIRLITDHFGMTEFDYLPGFPRGALLIRANGEEDRIWLRDLPSGIVLIPSKRLIEPGDMLEVDVKMQQSNRPLFLDVLSDGRWVAAHSGRLKGNHERFGIPLPEGTKGLVILRASSGPEGSGSVHTSVWVDSSPQIEAVSNLAGALKNMPAATPLAHYRETLPPDPLVTYVSGIDFSDIEADSTELERLAGAMLSRVEARESRPPFLGDTTRDKLLALEEWKKRVRRPILVLLALIAGGVFIAVGYSAVSYQMQMNRMLEEFDDMEEADSGPVTQVSYFLPLLALGAVFLAAIAGLIIFLETLKWNRGDILTSRQIQEIYGEQ